ncbi:trace amine-associated receptor 13c-like [Sinocyclocheilus grahami]|uniref:Trace amine-associated receptor 13c-like n=1 Tax=Sinocyclocheilus grahami TaxID=75366 RepID=A0A672RK28_SINGR|nr:PREDICTED: trace amine-associated receptor 13c-like [Sinocyclocheilus grahami]
MNLTAMNQTDVCQEYWCPERSVSLSVYVILYVAAAAVSLLTVCGNLLVIISVSHFKQLHTPANILILSLAVCDLLVGVFVMPFHLSWLIESCWISGSVMCSVFSFVTFQATSVSVHTVALIAVDRFLALSSPFLYSEKISPTVICIATLFNWLFSLFYNFTLLFVNGNFADVTCPGICIASIDGVSSLIDLLFVFLMPCTLIIILYTHVFVIAKKHATAIRALQVHNSTQSSKNRVSDKSERKAAILLGILVLVFLLCLLPYYICTLVSSYDNADRFYVRNVAVIFFFLNSTINPIIYALFYPWFQKSLKLIFTFKVLNKDSSLMNLLQVTE